MRVRAKETGRYVRLKSRFEGGGMMYWLRIGGTRFE
jgi:hypothetical protein